MGTTSLKPSALHSTALVPAQVCSPSHHYLLSICLVSLTLMARYVQGYNSYGEDGKNYQKKQYALARISSPSDAKENACSHSIQG